MKKNTFLFLSSFLFLSACKVSEIQLDPDLKTHSQGMLVSGKNSLKFKRSMEFGAYSLVENKNAWPTTTNWNFATRFKKGKQNVQFDIMNKQGEANEFYGKSSLERVSLRPFRRISEWLPEIDVFVDDVFTGGVITPTGNWEFMLFDANRLTNKKAKGLLVNEESAFRIEEIRRLEGVKHFIETDRFGYAIMSDQEVVATVRLFGKGKIWIKETEPETTQHLLATVAAALLIHRPTDAG